MSCSQVGYFVKKSSCISCAEERSSSCPQKTRIEVASTTSELNQVIFITFSPSFIDQLSESALSTITAESLLKNHFNLSYKEKGGKEVQLTIVNSSLVHTKTSAESISTLRITFLQKLRKGEVESIRVKVINPWLSEAGGSNLPVVYVKKDWEQEIRITEKVKSDEEKDIERGEHIGSALSIGISLIAAMTLSMRALIGGAKGSVIYLIRFFNILDIVSNLEKINVKFGSKIKIAFRFIESLSLPEIPLLRSLSPLQDAEPHEPDSSAYQIIPRGSRAKMTGENGQVLLASGQNFVFSILVILLWVLMSILASCISNKSKVLKCVSFIYQTLIGLMFFDFQMISVTEVAFFDYNRIRVLDFKFTYSLILSVFNLVLILIEFLKAIILINERRRRIKESKSGEVENKRTDTLNEEEEKKRLNYNPNDEMIIEKYTESLAEGQQEGVLLFLNGDIRFFVIQVVIASLQHLNRSQSAIVLAINGGYLIYFIRVLLRERVFATKILLVKEIAQEVSIMVLISTITIFSFTEHTDFHGSNTYKAMELLAIFSIIGVCGAEFIILIKDILMTLKSCCKRSSKNKQKNEVISKYGVFEMGNQEEKGLKDKKEQKKVENQTTNHKVLFEKASKKEKEFNLNNNNKIHGSDLSLNHRNNKIGEYNPMDLFKREDRGGPQQNRETQNLNKNINITVQKKRKRKVNKTFKGFKSKNNKKRVFKGATSKNDEWNFEE